MSPCTAEADVCQADGAPGEEVGQPRQGQEPIKDGVSLRSFVDISQEAESERDDKANPWATFRVYQCAPSRAHAIFAKSLHSTGGSICARIGHANNRNRDNSVEDGWETLDAGGLDSNDEWRVSRVGTGRIGQIWVIRWDDETEDKQRNNVEESNAPEDLLGCLGNSLARIIALCRSETNELSTSEGKGGYDENGTKALKAVLERTGIAPVFTTNIAPMSMLARKISSASRSLPVVGWNSTAVDNYAQNDESNDSSDLDHAQREFNLTITSDATNINDSDENQEASDPDADIVIVGYNSSSRIFGPVSDCYASSSQFKR
jgi:hypothetical protein